MTKSLKDQLYEIKEQIKILEEQKRRIYEQSLQAPPEEKVCGDVMAEMCAEDPDDLFPAMQYPIDVSAIHWVEEKHLRLTPHLVRVRPVSDDKTYLGILIGDLPTGISASWHKDSQVLSISTTHYNPAIIVPELNRIVMGYESWWAKISTVEEVCAITNDMINKTWYVALLQQMEGSQPEEIESK